jgi:hypothetical protein
MDIIKVGAAVVLSGMLLGCAAEPMQFPLPVYFSAEDQKQVVAEWENMLTPVDKVDHQTLLDTVVAGHKFENGVDRFQMRTQTYLSHGSVVMEADCDRAAPLTDSFTITVLDDRGRTIRRDRYLRPKVEEATGLLLRWPEIVPTTQPGTTLPATDPMTGQPMTPEVIERTTERNNRLTPVLAATEPGTPTTAPSPAKP